LNAARLLCIIVTVDFGRAIQEYSHNGAPESRWALFPTARDNRADAQATGDLPADGAGLTVLHDVEDDDEETVMLEIVHDMVPNAELFFHDAGSNVIAFNPAIDALVSAGCRILCDDMAVKRRNRDRICR